MSLREILKFNTQTESIFSPKITSSTKVFLQKKTVEIKKFIDPIEGNEQK